MQKNNEIPDTFILRTKDIKTLLGVNDDKTARKYLNDIKENTGAPIPLYIHFKRYFKV